MKIKLMNCTPSEAALAGALGCKAQESSADILCNPGTKDKGKVVFKESFGRGHGSVGDQSCFTFSLASVSRLVTLFLCQSTHASHLQQSLRDATADEYYIPDFGIETKYKSVMDAAFDLYNAMMDAGIPGEDARYIIPLATKTKIQTTANARELCHYRTMLSKYAPKEVESALKHMDLLARNSGAQHLLQNYGPNYNPMSFYPAPDLFAEEGPIDGRHEPCKVRQMNKQHIEDVNLPDIDYIKNNNMAFVSLLKHQHFTFMCRMSIAALHQAIRQRTWDHTVQTLHSAATEGGRQDMLGIIIPPLISGTVFESKFIDQHFRMIHLYNEIVQKTGLISEAFNCLPHSLAIRTMIHINGWNAIYSIGKRMCSHAQWEIRDDVTMIANYIHEEMPALKKYIAPQCRFYGKCPEKVSCGGVVQH